jgi:stearoyl-CoA desaturase (Delta-9 desaturase)
MLSEQPKGDPLAGDVDVPDNYVQYTLKKEKSLPPVRWSNILNELNWLNVAILGVTPIVAIIGVCYTKLQWKTAVFAAIYYYFTGLGISKLSCLLLCILTIYRYHGWLP